MSMLPLGSQFAVPPGFSAVSETVENQFWFQGWVQNRRLPVLISGTARDSGNTTNTKVLRQGLAMGGPIYSTDGTSPYKVKEWNPTATDGSQYFLGFLLYNLSMYDQLGANQDRYCDLLIAGSVYSDMVIAYTNTATGISGTYGDLLVAAGQSRFIFDKHVKPIFPNIPLPIITLSDLGTTPNTLTYDHAGRVFANTGDGAGRTVNLPSPVPGMGPFRFYRLAAQTLTIDAGSGKVFYAPADLTKQTLVLTTVCGMVEVVAISTTVYLMTDVAGTVTPT